MFLKIFAFILGLTVTYRFNLVGQISISEVLIFSTALLVIGRRLPVLGLPFVKSIALLGVLWLLSQIFSDIIVNQSPRGNYLRGWANIIMIIGSFVFFLCLFIDDTTRLLWFIAGLIPAGLYRAFVVRDTPAPMGIAAHDEFWNLWVQPWAQPAMLLTAALLWRRSNLMAIVAMVLYGCFAIVGGARAHGMVFILAGAISLYVSRSSRLGVRATTMFTVRAAFIVIPIMLILFFAYVNLGLRGNLGPKTQSQLQALSQPYNPINVVMGARGQFYISGVAVADKPLFGHGSWAPAGKYAVLYREVTGSNLSIDLIPAHSTIFIAWIYAGILGAVFWVWVFIITYRMVYRSPTFAWDMFVPILCFLFAASMWNFLFSPFGFARFTWPVLMAGCLARIYYLGRLHNSPQPQLKGR